VNSSVIAEIKAILAKDALLLGSIFNDMAEGHWKD